MNAILIDADTQTVTDIECAGTLKDIYRILKCTNIDGLTVDGDIFVFHHALYVDGHGFLKQEDELEKRGPQTRWYFNIRNAKGTGEISMAPLAGKGLVHGIDSRGEPTDARITAVGLRPRVSFVRKRFLGMAAGQPDPAAGIHFMITPIFGEP